MRRTPRYVECPAMSVTPQMDFLRIRPVVQAHDPLLSLIMLPSLKVIWRPA